MNFILSEMTFLRYFIPIIIEGNRRGIESTIVVGNGSAKYNSVTKAENVKFLIEHSKKYKFKLINYNEWDSDELTFFVEGQGSYNSILDEEKFIQVVSGDITKNSPKQKFVSLTYMTDYQFLYKDYIKYMDNVIFPSKPFAEEFENTVTDKNLYLGSPKYDVEVKTEKKDKPRALVIYPDQKAHPRNLDDIYECLKKYGFEIFVKTRGKNKVHPNYKGDKLFSDGNWFPHSTLELIHNSDLVVNFDSTVIEEIIMYEKPILNFHSLNGKRQKADFDKRVYTMLYEHDFLVDLKHNERDKKLILDGIKYLMNTNFDNVFSEVKEKYFWKNNASKTILDTFKGEYNE